MQIHWVVFILLFTCTAEAGQLYRWTDEHGVTHFSDSPTPDARPIEVGPLNGYSAPAPAQVPAPPTPTFRQPKVIMYGTEWCGVCQTARRYFRRHNVRFTEYDVEKSARGKRDYRRMGGKSVPIFLVDGERINGFSEARFGRLVGR